MQSLKVSLICTVLNEANTLETFIDSIYSMECIPDEFIIVDGGSTDGTAEILENYSKRYNSLNFFIEKGGNIARGRNIAIKNAQNDIIAILDAGSRPDKFWLDQLLSSFKIDELADIVAGRTVIEVKNSFQKWLSLLQKPIDKIDYDKYLPSARSLAFKKKCWEAVGGFPEYLTNWGEDTLFMKNLKKCNYRLVINNQAIVFWQPRENLRKYWLQHFHYGQGDGEAGLDFLLNLKRAILVVSPIVFIIGLFYYLPIAIFSGIFLIAAFIRLMFPLRFNQVPIWRLFPLFGLVLIAETAQVLGYLKGIMKKIKVS